MAKRNKSVAAPDKGRTERPVFESPSVAVRRARSSSETFSARPSPRLQPVSSRKRVKAIVGGQISLFFSALRRASPALVLAVLKPFDATHRIVRPHLVADGIREDRSE